MSDSKPLKRTIAQPPEKLCSVKTSCPSKSAGGLGAVLQSFKHGLSEMGLLRTLQTFRQVNQKEGFDCPGCAWPDPKHRSPFEFCENGAKAVAEEATYKRVDPNFFQRHSVEELGHWTDYQLGKAGRLTHPMLLEKGATHYRKIDWKEGFDLLASALLQLDDPNKACFYTSGRTSNEAAFLYQLFVRRFGTNNMPDCSNMCHESSGKGLGATIGIGKGTVTLEDFDKTDAIFVIGQNPGTNHPRMMTALRGAKKNGAKIVTMNPLKEVGLMSFTHPQSVGDMLSGGVSLTDLYLQVRINGDLAAMKGIMKHLFDMEAQNPGSVIDTTFIQERTLDFENFEYDIRNADWSEIESDSGLSKAQLKEAADIYAQAKSVIVCWAMGLTQHENGIANIQSCVNLLLLGGHFGRDGAGVCPVRGHSNVQGNRTVGIWEAPSDAFLDRLGKGMNFEPPRDHGLAVVPAIEAMHNGKISLFFALGGNFISATPDTEYTAQALKKCKLTVQVSTKLNRSHLITGDTALIFPCLGRTEHDQQTSGPQFVTVENSMGIVHRSQGRLTPASKELLSEPRIVAEIASRVTPVEGFDWLALTDNYDSIRDLIEASIAGFENYNKRVRHRDGFELPNGPREGRFTTKSTKAHFTVHPLPKHHIPKNHLMMMTMRSHDQYNTTIYGLEDRYRGVGAERRVVLMNKEDMAEMSLSERDVVDLFNRFNGRERVARLFVVIGYDIPKGSCATYFPEANVLVPIDKFAVKSLTPASKSVVIEIRPAKKS